MRHAAPAATERVRSPDDHRVSGFLDERSRHRGVGDRPAPWDRLPDRPHEGCEPFPVLSRGDRLHLRPEELHLMAAHDYPLREVSAHDHHGLSPPPPAQTPSWRPPPSPPSDAHTDGRPLPGSHAVS